MSTRCSRRELAPRLAPWARHAWRCTKDEERLLLQQRGDRRRREDEEPPRRQGRQPGRHGQAGDPCPTGVHDHDGSLRLLPGARRPDSEGTRSRGRGAPEEAREGDGQEVRRSEEPAPRLGAIRRRGVDAGHDGHDPESRPERRDGARPRRGIGQRTVRVRLLPPPRSDVRRRRHGTQAGDRSRPRPVRRDPRRAEEGEEGEARHRPLGRRSEDAGRAVQGGDPEEDGQDVPAGSEGTALGLDLRRVPLVEQPARGQVPRAVRDQGTPRHGRQRPGDGVRQHGRRLRHGRRVHAEPVDRREPVLRRVPHERAGRGRRRRHPHASSDHRAREGHADVLPRARRHPREARVALPRDAGRRVHDRARHPVHAADAQRQAHGRRRRADRGRDGGRQDDRQERSAAARHARADRSASPSDVRHEGREEGARPDARPPGEPGRGERRRRLLGRGRRNGCRGRASASSSCASRPRRRTSAG